MVTGKQEHRESSTFLATATKSPEGKMLKPPNIAPMRLLHIHEPFDHPEFLFEPKMDGFRALADVNGHHRQLISRKGHVFKSWPQPAEEIAHSVREPMPPAPSFPSISYGPSRVPALKDIGKLHYSRRVDAPAFLQ
jgi:hypothetical protein